LYQGLHSARDWFAKSLQYGAWVTSPIQTNNLALYPVLTPTL
jgi:hypothetical protein